MLAPMRRLTSRPATVRLALVLVLVALLVLVLLCAFTSRAPAAA